MNGVAGTLFKTFWFFPPLDSFGLHNSDLKEPTEESFYKEENHP